MDAGSLPELEVQCQNVHTTERFHKTNQSSHMILSCQDTLGIKKITLAI